MPSYCTADYTFTLDYDAGTQLLLAYWRGTVPAADLYAHYAELMTTAEAHGNCRFWELNVGERNWHTPGFRHWFANEFVPLLHAAMQQPVFIAYVVSPAQAKLVKTPIVQAVEYNSAQHDVYPFFFDSEAAARDWLTHQQAHDEGRRRGRLAR
jgi:hypothetical protein